MQWSEVDAVLRQAMPRADEGDEAAAWAALAPLETRAENDATAARGLAIALAHRRLGRDELWDALGQSRRARADRQRYDMIVRARSAPS